MNFKKWQVVLLDLEPAIGSEKKKTRPCLIISPNVINSYFSTILIAPFTSRIRNIPTRYFVHFNARQSEICFDQIKVVDKSRIIKTLGTLEEFDKLKITRLLQNMFSEM